MLKYIYILPLGEVSLDFLGKLKKDLENKFGFKIEIRNRVEMPDYVYNKEKDQYNSRIILNELTKLSFKNTEKILAITDLDLFTEDLSYIFGQAETSGKICLISSKRLNPKFYNKNFDKDLFYSRILKEAIHELGHTFGLKHCKNKKCVMHFSNNIEETDFKKSEFCEECGRVYQYVVL
jgi:archaemetzincin